MNQRCESDAIAHQGEEATPGGRPGRYLLAGFQAGIDGRRQIGRPKGFCSASVSSGQGGLGWFIFENRNLLDIPAVFAGLLTMIVIGLVVESLIFRTIQRNTVQKWGTQS